jgi:hypothetical protein
MEIEEEVSPKFYLRDLQLSRYALSCGYVQCKETKFLDGTYAKVELYKEHNCYHIGLFLDDKKQKEFSTWSIGEARKKYKECLAEYTQYCKNWYRDYV